jgi:hypothetical protein
VIKVYDDLIPQHLQDYFEMVTLGKSSEELIHPTVDFKCKYETTAYEAEREYAPISFVHVLRSNTALSPHLENFSLIPMAACQENNLILRNIVVARIFITMPYDTTLEHYAPHVDYPGEHTVCIYYVNDADGDTVFFDKAGKNIIQRVTPKKGRVVLFDGKILHGGGIPKNGPRCIVNFDLHT